MDEKDTLSYWKQPSSSFYDDVLQKLPVACQTKHLHFQREREQKYVTEQIFKSLPHYILRSNSSLLHNIIHLYLSFFLGLKCLLVTHTNNKCREMKASLILGCAK